MHKFHKKMNIQEHLNEGFVKKFFTSTGIRIYSIPTCIFFHIFASLQLITSPQLVSWTPRDLEVVIKATPEPGARAIQV